MLTYVMQNGEAICQWATQSHPGKEKQCSFPPADTLILRNLLILVNVKKAVDTGVRVTVCGHVFWGYGVVPASEPASGRAARLSGAVWIWTEWC
jgi:hypothetical protein